MRKVRFLSAADAVGLIPDNATVATSGFVGCAHPEELTLAVERRFQAESNPRNLTLVYAAGQGDGRDRGLNHFAFKGLIKRVVGGHWNLAPKLGMLAIENEIEAYNFPQGVIVQLFRDIAAHNPGTITHIGLGTFVDPRRGGGKLNERTLEDLVELLQVGGREWLLYKAFPIDIALLRGTASDSFGNVSFDDEVLTGEALSIAQAAKNSGGKVIVQVDRMADEFSRDPKAIRLPGIFVDIVVLASKTNHMQTFAEQFNSSYITQGNTGETEMATMEEGPRRYIARRALNEIQNGDVVNLGIGIPEGIAQIAKEQNRLDDIVLTVEAGAVGGIPASGLSFGASVHPMAIIDQSYMFDFYSGGGLDAAFLSMAECDWEGSVNVSKFAGRIPGVGGFMNIAQPTGKVVFLGTFTAGGLRTTFEHGQLRICAEGKARKFTRRVEQITFSGPEALRRGKEVLYITERAVFRLTGSGLELIEIAPGIDLSEAVLGQMDFTPAIAANLRIMPASVFGCGCRSALR
jgi:propionate CoA-transferase